MLFQETKWRLSQECRAVAALYVTQDATTCVVTWSSVPRRLSMGTCANISLTLRISASSKYPSHNHSPMPAGMHSPIYLCSRMPYILLLWEYFVTSLGLCWTCLGFQRVWLWIRALWSNLWLLLSMPAREDPSALEATYSSVVQVKPSVRNH